MLDGFGVVRHGRSRRFPRLEGQKAYLDYEYLMKLQDIFLSFEMKEDGATGNVTTSLGVTGFHIRMLGFGVRTYEITYSGWMYVDAWVRTYVMTDDQKSL